MLRRQDCRMQYVTIGSPLSRFIWTRLTPGDGHEKVHFISSFPITFYFTYLSLQLGYRCHQDICPLYSMTHGTAAPRWLAGGEVVKYYSNPSWSGTCNYLHLLKSITLPYPGLHRRITEHGYSDNRAILVITDSLWKILNHLSCHWRGFQLRYSYPYL